MKQRIIGVDVARALAVIGMIIVNFKIVLGNKGNPLLESIASAFDGKSAATFVILAGVGLALMTNSTLEGGDKARLKKARIRIFKRALFLFVAGLSYIAIWPADILHFYGIYMLVVLALLTSSEGSILAWALGIILIYPFLMGIHDYQLGWNFETLAYSNFWTFRGFLRNLFYNGFHPVLPWAAFMLVGFWFGKQDLGNPRYLKKAFWISTLGFILIQALSFFSISALSAADPQALQELTEILGTAPMPPLPIYMFNGIAIGIAVISGCVLISMRLPENRIVIALNKAGQLALTFYVAHVVLGMGIIEVYSPEKMGEYTLEFSISYALAFSLSCLIFAELWLRKFTYGPLEVLMKKLIR